MTIHRAAASSAQRTRMPNQVAFLPEAASRMLSQEGMIAQVGCGAGLGGLVLRVAPHRGSERGRAMEPTDYRSFLVRLWRAAGADGREQWCGEVEHIQSGRTERFTSFENLMTLLRPAALHPPLGGGDQAMPQQAPEDAA